MLSPPILLTNPPARLRTPRGAALLVGLLGLTISLVGITTPSIWYDEAATITAATRSWPQLVQMLGTVDAVHGLYYALMHVVFDLFGYSPLSLRVPSAIAVAATGALTVLLGTELFRLRTAVIAGIVFTLLPRTTWMGTEGRSYALTATLAVALTLVLVRALRSTGHRTPDIPRLSRTARRLWILYGVLVVVSCLLFLYLALVVIAHAAALAAVLFIRHRRARRPAAAWALSTALATAAVLPFALIVMSQSQQLHWLDPLGRQTLRQVLVGQWFYTSVPFAIVGWALMVAGAAVLLHRSRLTIRSVPLSDTLAPALAPALLLALIVVPTVTLLATTELYTPIYTPRYLTMCVPFVGLLMAVALEAGITRFVRNRRGMSVAAAPAAAVVLCAVFTALAVPQIAAQRESQAKENTSWSAVADSIGASRASDGADSTTAIVYGGVQFHPIATARVIAYSYPDAFDGTIDVTLDTPAAETGRLWETTRPLSTSLDRLREADVVYLVSSFSRDIRADTTRTLGNAGWRVADSWDITDVHVIRYVRG